MLKKASKRLVSSIIALVASSLLCIGVCLAWFAANKNVSGNGMQSQLRGGDIIDFTVTAYYLNSNPTKDGEGNIISYEKDAAGNILYYTTTNGNTDKIGDPIKVGLLNTSLTVDGNTNGTIESSEDMRPFSLGGAYTTMVLLKIDYTLAKEVETGKTFRIFAECDALPIANVAVDENGVYKSNLSNAIKFSNVADNQSVTPYEEIGQNVSFVPAQENNVNKFPEVEGTERELKINFFEGITAGGDKNADGNYIGTKLLMMDYDSDEFAYLSSLMLEKGGNLNSKLNLKGDITFGMEVYDSTAHTHIASGAWEYDDSYHWHVCADGDAIVDFAPHVNETGNDNLCDECEQPVGAIHTHIAGPNWVSNATNHWKLCTAGDGYKMNEEAHTFSNGKCSVCGYIPVTSVTISGATEVEVGKTITLSAKVLPADATNNAVTWTSSNTDVATVSNGVVKGVAEGEVTITATAGGVSSEAYTVTVKASTTPDPTTYTVTFNMNGHGTDVSKTVNSGEKVTAPTAPTASGYTFGGWYTDKNCTTEFDFNTAITADTTLYAKWTKVETTTQMYDLNLAGPDHDIFETHLGTGVDSGYQSTHFKIGSGDTLVITLNVKAGDTVHLSGVARASAATKATSLKFTPSVSNCFTTEIAGVSISANEGSVSFNYTLTVSDTFDGTSVQITLDRGNVKTTGCELTQLHVGINETEVTAVSSITIDGVSSLTVGNSSQFTASVAPNNATHNKVVWGITGNARTEGTATINMATINPQTGLLTATEPCEVTITAYAGGKIATKKVTITAAAPVEVTGVTLDKETLTLQLGSTETGTLTATVKPDNATNKTVTWTSNKEDVATVVDGVVTAHKAGTATITATAGGKSATCQVTVEAAPHTHTAGDTWEHDETNHWKLCTAGDGEIMNLAAHTEAIDAAVAPTCTETGLTEGKHCSVCNTVIVAQEEVPATGHTDSDNNKVCDVCGASMPSGGTGWTLDLSNATEMTYEKNDFIGEKLKVVEVGAGLRQASSYLSAKKGVELSFEVKAGAKLSITWNAEQSARTYQILNSSGTEVAKGSMIKGTTTIPLNTADTYTLKITEGEHKITKIEISYEADPTPTPTVTGVTVTAADNKTTVENGGTLQLTATVAGTNNPAQTVTWSIKAGATATEATVKDGVLSAGTVAGTVTVVATSTADTSKSGEITITVEAAPHTHTAGDTWEHDETNHWHVCTAGDGHKMDEAAHTDDNSDGKCDTCEYQTSTLTGTNLVAGLTAGATAASGEAIYSGNNITILGDNSDSKFIKGTATKFKFGDKEFENAIVTHDNKKAIAIKADNNVTITVYYTVAKKSDGTAAKGKLTAQKYDSSGQASGTAKSTSITAGTVETVTYTLKAGEYATFTTDNEAIAILGVYVS